MNKYFRIFLIFVLILFFQQVAISKSKYSVSNAMYTKSYITYVRQGIAILHNVLNLSDEQIIKTIDIMAKYDTDIDKLSNKIIDKCKALEILQKNNASYFETGSLKREIRSLNSDLHKLLSSEIDDFIDILDRKQRQKYHLIMHLNNYDCKRDRKEKKYMQKLYNF